MILTSKIILFSSIFYIVMSRHMDFRERFLERKRQRALNAHRVHVLNKVANTAISDDITHYRKFKGRLLQKKRDIEKDFRRLIAMDGMKYTYKRDLFWRTWRTIPLLIGATKEIVYYKCNNLKYANGTISQSCGTWSIEERTPPCAFEFFSLKSEGSFCGANITQYKDVKHNCPSVIKFSDLTATCDNPIETQWRFTQLYGVSEEHEENVICKNQDFCKIFTTYEITPEHVVFRIINSTNDVIYSRIMKPKKKNYICIEDCGHFNSETRKVTKANGKPLKLDLLARKIKRNNLLNEFITKKEILNEINENLGYNENVTKRDLLNEINKNVTTREDLNGKNKHVTKKDLLNRKNENITKKQKLLNEIVKKREKLNDSETKRAVLNNTDMIRDEVLNEINNSDAKDDLVNEINDIDAKGDLVNETNESDTYTDELVNEMNDNDANEDVLNDSAHLSATKRDKLINELLPMEEDLSTLNWGGSKFDIVSVEVNALNNIKSGRKQMYFTVEKDNTIHRPRTTTGKSLASKEEKHSDSILDKPTVTPRMKMKKDFVSYEDDNQELEYV